MDVKKIAFIGECMIELNGVPFGEMLQSYGGDALNSAVYLARAAGPTLDVYFVSAMGADPVSKGMICRWQAEGVNTDCVLIDPHHQPGLYLIQLDEHGERTFLYWRNDSAARYLLRHLYYPQLCERLSQMDAIYLSGISLAIFPDDDRDSLLLNLHRLSAQGKTILFDSNYRHTLWENEAKAKDCYKKICSITDVALVTYDDEAHLWGDKSIEETFSRLSACGVKQVIVKAGSEGCYYQNFDDCEKKSYKQITAESVEHVVDTTSAGDAFNAGFIAGFLNGLDIESSARMGHQIAGVVIQHKGAIIPESMTKPITADFLRAINERGRNV
ncbi:sugar kinase [Escherichia coli O13,129, 135:H26]